VNAIVIDPYTRTIRFVDLPDIAGDDNGRDAYNMLRLAIFEGQDVGIIQGIQVGEQHMLWIDEESLLKPWEDQAFFSVNGNPPIGGRGVIVGLDHDGGTLPCTGALAPVVNGVQWVEPRDVVVPAPTWQRMNGELEPEGEPEVLDGGPAEWTFANHGGRR
jgi:hypothetical protein